MSSLCTVITLDVLETGVAATLLLTWRERLTLIWPEFNTIIWSFLSLSHSLWLILFLLPHWRPERETQRKRRMRACEGVEEWEIKSEAVRGRVGGRGYGTWVHQRGGWGEEERASGQRERGKDLEDKASWRARKGRGLEVVHFRHDL